MEREKRYAGKRAFVDLCRPIIRLGLEQLIENIDSFVRYCTIDESVSGGLSSSSTEARVPTTPDKSLSDSILEAQSIVE